MKSSKHNFGKFEKKLNGVTKLVEKGPNIGLIQNTIIGFTYKVESNTIQQLKVKNVYYYPNGKGTTTEYTIETNALFACLLTIPTVQKEMLGNFRFVVNFPEHPEIEPQEQTFYVFDQTQGVLFQNNSFTPATEQNIEAFEHKYKTLLCDDYKQFLKTHNGMYLHWWHYSNEFDQNKGAYQSDKYGFLQTHYPFHEDLGKRYNDWDWIHDTRVLFGIGNNNPYLDIKDVDSINLFYHNNLMPIL